LGDPAGDRVRRDAGDPHETTVVVDEHEHVEPGEKDRVGPDLRGDGSMPWRFRIAQTLEGAMTTPVVASSPRMRR
jgi:hypothetical protein